MYWRDKLFLILINFIYKLYRKDWIISENNFYKNNFLKRKKILFEDEEIEPDQNQKIIILKKNKIKKGWYFLGIYHLGENKRSLLTIKNSIYNVQCRPAFANKRRWRIIRIRKQSNLILELSQIKNTAKIREIWLIKIPGFFAWFKIKKRIETSFSKIYLRALNKENTWRIYNSILRKQFSIHKKFNYQDWIKISEPLIYSSILKKIKNYEYKKNFIILNELIKVSNDQVKWVVIIRKNAILNNKFEKILQWIESHNNKINIFYGDEDYLSINDIRYSPKFKPGWNRELFWSDPLYSSHWIVSSELWNLICSDNKDFYLFEFEKVIFSLVEKLILTKRETEIKHVPFVISHRLNNFDSSFNKKFINHILNLKIHLKNIYPNKFICVKEGIIKKTNFIEWANPKDILISIIIPTRDKVNLLRKCIESIHKYCYSSNMEIIIINNNSIEKSTFLYFDELKNKSIKNISHKILDFNESFNYSKINNYAINKSIGDTLILVNNDIEFLSENWDLYLSSNANRDDIGCVGAKLLFDDFSIQHAGVILGIGGVAGHSHKYFPLDSTGYYGRLNMCQEYSAVTAACLCITKSKWLKIGGLDERNLAVNYNDVDLCLKSKKCNLRNIFLPHVMAIHHESKTRGELKGETFSQWKREYKFMQKKWGNQLKKDIFYSPYLSLEEEDWSISLRDSEIYLR